jgi:hypothetical protein
MYPGKYIVYVQENQQSKSRCIHSAIVTENGLLAKGLEIRQSEECLDIAWILGGAYDKVKLEVLGSSAVITYYDSFYRYIRTERTTKSKGIIEILTYDRQETTDPIFEYTARIVCKMAGIEYKSYQKQDEWLVRYFSIALGCGYPILHSLMLMRYQPPEIVLTKI